MPSDPRTDAAQALLDAIDAHLARGNQPVAHGVDPTIAARIYSEDSIELLVRVRAALAAASPDDESPWCDLPRPGGDTCDRRRYHLGDCIANSDGSRALAAASPPPTPPYWEDPDYQDWLNELMDNAGDEWDGDDAMEAIAMRYVRHLEALAAASPPAPTDMDSIGRFIAQALADTGLTVGTYGVLADLIHVTTPDGRLYDVTLDEPSGMDDVV